MFESTPTENKNVGYTKEALWQQHTELEYLILVPNRLAHNDNGLSLEGFRESHFYPRRATNYLGGIYLTQPTTTYSILSCDRGLSAYAHGNGTSLRNRGGLQTVSV